MKRKELLDALAIAYGDPIMELMYDDAGNEINLDINADSLSRFIVREASVIGGDDLTSEDLIQIEEAFNLAANQIRRVWIRTIQAKREVCDAKQLSR